MSRIDDGVTFMTNEELKALDLALEAFAVYDRKGWLETSPRTDLREALAVSDKRWEGL